MELGHDQLDLVVLAHHRTVPGPNTPPPPPPPPITPRLMDLTV